MPKGVKGVAGADAVECLVLRRRPFQRVLSSVSHLLGDREQFQDNEQMISLARHISRFSDLIAEQEKDDGGGGGGGGSASDGEGDGSSGGRKAVPSIDGSVSARGLRGSSGTRGLMSELMSAFAPELNLDDVIERLVKVTYRIFKVDRVGLFYHHRSSHSLPGDDGAFGAEGASGASTDDRLVMMIAKEGRGLSLPVRGIAGHCATHSAVVNVEDAYQDARFDSTLDRRTGYRTQARKIRFETHRSHRSIDR